jgi:hypothetical protein
MYHLKMVVLCPFKTICINLKMVALSAVKICINLKMGAMCVQNIDQSKDDGTMGDHNMYGTNLKLIALFAVTMYQTKDGMTWAVTTCKNLEMHQSKIIALSAVTMYQSKDGATCAVTICINLKMVPPRGSQYVSMLR